MKSSAIAAIVLVAACYPEGTDPSLDCVEFTPGRPVKPTLHGSAASFVVVQSVADFTLATTILVGEVEATCRQIASDLGVTDDSSEPDGDSRAAKNCALAADAIRSARGSAKLSLTGAISCTPSPNERAICDAQCPTCATLCDLASRVRSDCYSAAVTVDGANDVLKSALERSYGSLRLLNARAALLKDTANVSSTVNGVTDFKAACIPVVLVSVQTTGNHLASAVASLGAIIDAVESTPDAGP